MECHGDLVRRFIRNCFRILPNGRSNFVPYSSQRGTYIRQHSPYERAVWNEVGTKLVWSWDEVGTKLVRRWDEAGTKFGAEKTGEVPITFHITCSNTFWMISGTSNMLSKSGPADLPIITTILQKHTRKMWAHPLTYYFPYLRIWKIVFWIFERYRHLLFVFVLFRENEYIYIYLYKFTKMRIGRW